LRRLTLQSFLIRRTKRLAYLLALRLGCGAFRHPLIGLLFAQIMQLLPRVPIAPRCLFRQVGYLPLACLLSGDIAWLRLRWNCRTLIRHLQLFVFTPIVYSLDSHSLR
jgi:hypothetical protein